jgi:hypothetical protein
MNNKPVAWTDGKGNYFDKNSFFPVDDLIPLYVYPAKELTNEEISDIRDEFFAPDGCNIYTFARALLKKASEI